MQGQAIVIVAGQQVLQGDVEHGAQKAVVFRKVVVGHGHEQQATLTECPTDIGKRRSAQSLQRPGCQGCQGGAV